MEELNDLMDIIHQVLPIGPHQWESVESDYNTHYPERVRTVDNLRRQFNKQCNKKAPTGDPNIPKCIRIGLAKTAQREIIAKGNAVTLGEDSGTDNESVLLEAVDGGKIVDDPPANLAREDNGNGVSSKERKARPPVGGGKAGRAKKKPQQQESAPDTSGSKAEPGES